MTLQAPENPPREDAPPELVMTRVSGGSSARLIALGVAGLLVALVGFNVVNRPSVVTQPPPLGQPSPSAPAPLGTMFIANPAAFDEPRIVFVGGATNDFGFAALIQMAGGDVHAAMNVNFPGRYRAEVAIPLAGLARKLPISINREWTDHGPVISESLGTFSISLKALRKSPGKRVTLLVKEVRGTSIPPFADTPPFLFEVRGLLARGSIHLVLVLVGVPATR